MPTLLLLALACRPAAVLEPAPVSDDRPVAEWHHADPPGGPGATAPTLTAEGDRAHLAWIEPAGEQMAVRWSRYHGGVWSEPVTIHQSNTLFVNWADRPAVREAPDGSLLAWWLEKSAPDTYAYDVKLARSTDAGVSWTALGSPHRDGTPTEHGFVSAVPEGSDLRLFWLDGRGTGGGHEGHGGGGPMTLRTAVVGAKITPDDLVDDRVCDCCGTDAALWNGQPAVVYRNRSDGGEIRDIHLARPGEGGWSRGVIHMDGWEVAGCPVNGPALDTHGDHAAVAWFTAADDRARVEVAFSSGRGFAEPLVLDENKPLGRVDLWLAQPDRAWVSWIASGESADRLRLQQVGPAGPLGAATTLAETAAGRASGFPMLARVGAELLLVWPAGTEAGGIRAKRSSLPHERAGG